VIPLTKLHSLNMRRTRLPKAQLVTTFNNSKLSIRHLRQNEVLNSISGTSGFSTKVLRTRGNNPSILKVTSLTDVFDAYELYRKREQSRTIEQATKEHENLLPALTTRIDPIMMAEGIPSLSELQNA